MYGGYIYFLLAPGTQRIKVGFSKNPTQRIRLLRTMSSEPLVTLVILRGSRQHELMLHAHFKRDRAHGEWFSATDQILAFAQSFKNLENISLEKIRRFSHHQENLGVTDGEEDVHSEEV